MQLSRTSLTIGDRDRDWLYAWSIDGELAGRFTLVGTNGTFETEALALGWARMTWDEPLHRGFRLYPDTNPGNYALHCGGTKTPHIITVRPAAWNSLPNSLLRPSNEDTEQLQKALFAGNVSLVPGESYTLTTNVVIPAGRTINGAGAHLFKRPNSGNYRDAMFIAGDDSTIRRLNLHPNNYVFTGDTYGRGMNILDCDVYDGQLGHWNQRDDLIQDVRFHRASAGAVQSGFWHRCRWTDMCQAFHSFLAERGERLAVVDAVFDGTDRGITLRSGWGPSTEGLFSSIEFRSISRVNNGCELFTCEGSTTAGISRTMFLHWRSYNCEGQINAWDAPFNDNLLRDFVLDGNTIMLAGVRGVSQSRNRFLDMELRGGQLLFGPTANYNAVSNVAFIGWKPTRSNQFDKNPHTPNALIVCEGSRGGTNTFATNVTVYGKPSELPLFAVESAPIASPA